MFESIFLLDEFKYQNLKLNKTDFLVDFLYEKLDFFNSYS